MARIKSTPHRISKILGLTRYFKTSVLPNATKYDDKLPIIPFYVEDGNTFINILTEMYNRSAMHKACIMIKHVLACGDGYMIIRKDGQPYQKNQELEDFLNNINEYGENANDVLKKNLFDEIFTRMHTLKIVQEGENISVLNNDISTFRLAKPVDNRLKDCYISYSWAEKELAKYDVGKLDELAKRLPLFDGSDQPESIIYSKPYETGRYYYAVPDYFTLEFKRWSDISYAIPTYNHARFENMFAPSGMITFIGQPPDGKTGDEFSSDVMKTFTGEGNNAKMLISVVEDAAQAPKVELFAQAQEGLFTVLSELSTTNTLRAHRMHPSILMATAGSLGEASQLKTVFDTFYKNVIEGYQKPVLRTWDRILELAGFGEYALDIANNSPISLLGNIDLSNILSVNEIRTELGYEELKDVQSETKTLAELIGVGGLQSMTAIISDVNLTNDAKRGLLKVAFNLTDEQIESILPKPII